MKMSVDNVHLLVIPDVIHHPALTGIQPRDDLVLLNLRYDVRLTSFTFHFVQHSI